MITTSPKIDPEFHESLLPLVGRAQDDAADLDGVKDAAAILPAALMGLFDGSAARREARLRKLRALHQRTRAARSTKRGGNR